MVRSQKQGESHLQKKEWYKEWQRQKKGLADGSPRSFSVVVSGDS